MAEQSQSRRGFLRTATLAMGGAIGAVMAWPVIRYLVYPVGRRVVDTGKGLVDVLAADVLKPGGKPVKAQITASGIRDAWSVANDVGIGATWLRKTKEGKVEAFSTVCPHLGCAVGFDADQHMFRCPCHGSTFALDGKRLGGPTKRGLDPLPVSVKKGRVLVKYVRYRLDVSDREPV